MRTISIALLVAFLFSGCDIVEKDPVPAQLVRTVLHQDNYQVPQNGLVEIDVLANDTLKGSFTLKMGSPKVGKTTRTSGFKFNYEPAPGFVGTDSISYEVIIDGKTMNSVVAIVVLRNCNLTAVTDTITLEEGTILVYDPLANDISCGATLTATYGDYSEAGLVVSSSGNGHLRVSAANGYFKTKTVSYTLCNNFNECTTGTIVIKVVPSQVCATTLKANPDSYSTTVNSPLLLPYERLLLNDNFCLNDVADTELEIIGNTQFGTLRKFANYFVYTPDVSVQAATESLEYRIRSKRFPTITSTATLVISVQ